MLVDSNVLIYATKPEHAKLRQWLICNIGDFSWIEELKVFNPLEAG